MCVSHETIYQSLHVQSRGSLPSELSKHLRGGKSAIATLVERRSRFVMLVQLPEGRASAHVCSGLPLLAALLIEVRTKEPLVQTFAQFIQAHAWVNAEGVLRIVQSMCFME